MAIHPDSSFPLRANDQADVIRIYLELRSENDHSDRAREVKQAIQSFDLRNHPNGAGIPNELFDLD